MENKEMERLIREIHTALLGSIEGNKPGLMERVRILECFHKAFNKAFIFIVSLACTNIAAIITAGILVYLRLRGS